MFEWLYSDLRRIARSHMRRELAGHTLSATGLVHEAWFLMAEHARTVWRNRSHFLAVASTMMRHILVNHEQASLAGQRKGGFEGELLPPTLAGIERLGSPATSAHDRRLSTRD